MRTSSLALVRTSSTIQLRCYGPILPLVSITIKSRYDFCLLLIPSLKSTFSLLDVFIQISIHLRSPLSAWPFSPWPSLLCAFCAPFDDDHDDQAYLYFMKYIFVVGVNCHVRFVHPFFLLLCFKLNFVSKNLKLSPSQHFTMTCQTYLCAATL